MITTLLFDLDDTLLGNPLDAFLRGYFGQMARHFALGEVDAKRLVDAVFYGTNVMVANTDPTRELLGIFYEAFFPKLGWEAAENIPRFDEFYQVRFPKLQPLTEYRPAARAVMEWAFGVGYQVVIATSPIFPMRAVRERMRWAGVDDFPYALVTAIEKCHFAKPHPEYFAEVLARLDKRPDEALVVGNDWEADMVPAARLGLPHYWIASPESVPPANTAHPVGIGPLEAFLEWAPLHLPALAAPALPDTGLPILLTGDLAELAGLLADLPEAAWQRRPELGEWSLGEIVCHLRDIEKEVYVPRLLATLESDNPILASVNTANWAEERGYQAQAGQEAWAAFVQARRDAYSFLGCLPESAWHRSARHPRLGNLTLARQVGRIMDHDRSHLAQVRVTRQKAVQ